MKIAYNPLTADALTVAPSNNDITFDLKGVAIYAKGVKFKGTDTTYSVFKKHTSDDEGGYSGLVPVPSYNENSKNRYLREDGTWENPSLTIGNYVTLDTDQEITGTKTFTKQLKFTVATGTAPFEVTSKTLVTNLNAEISNYINYTSRAAKGDGFAQFCQYDGETDNPTKDWYSHIIMNHANSNGYYTEIATCFHSDSVYFRRQHAGVTSEWKKFAFIDSDITGNALTADKLKTKIKLWGLDFDGSADVSGNMTSVGTINEYFNFQPGSSVTAVLHAENIYADIDYIHIYVSNLDKSRKDIPLVLQNGYGNVGINIDSPKYSLDVNGNARTTYLTFNEDDYSPNTGNGRIGSFDRPSSVSVQIGGYGTTQQGSDYECFRIINNAWDTDLFHVTNLGDVGIGTTDPTYKLHVKGDSYTTDWARAGSGFYVEKQGVHYMSNGTVGQIYMSNNNEFNWSTTNGSLYFNYRYAANGNTVTNYIWNAGSSSSYASHTLGSLTTKGTIASYPNADASSNLTYTYSGGGYFATDVPNIRLYGDNTYGISTIEFVSQKGTTNINSPSDCGFIQFLPYGISSQSFIGSAPSLNTSGEANRLVIGVNNDSGDQVWIQTPSISDLRHIVGTNNYQIISSGNIGSQSVNYATNSTYLYASDSPYRYGDSAPYYMRMRYNVNGDNRWYLSVYPETPKTIAVDYSYYASSADSAATLSGGSIPTWGTLTAANGYTNVCTWDTGNTTGAFSLAGKGGQMSLQLDGFFYQNEGLYLVLDTNNYSSTLDGRYVKKAGDTMSGGLTINASNKSAPLILKGGLNNYREGLRIIPYGGWSDILLAGSDASETSGTSTNSWFIGNNNGKLYINKGNSSEKGNPRAMGTSTGWTFGNTDLNSYALNTASFICNSWVRTKGPTGWYNEDYGGGWYMIDSTWIRNYNSKQTYLSVSTYPSLVCNAQSGNDTNIRFDLNGSAKGYVGYLKSYGTFLYNLASNKYVYINDSGYFYTQSYINVGAGNEKNASSPPYVWGVNGSDNFMRTYATSSLSVGYADRINSLGNKSASDLSSTYGSGLTTSGIYNNGWPFSYGCVITTNANGGVFQIAGQWNSSITGSNNCDYSTEMYIRNRRDSYDVWSTWTKVLTNRNSSVSGGGSSGGSNITVNIGGTSKTLTIPTSLPANGGNASTVTVNSSDYNSTYRMVWHSGNTLYGTGGIYCNPSTDYLYATSMQTSHWFRSTGPTGWYNESYGGGIYMIDASYVRTYNDKALYVSNTGDHAIYAAGGFASARTNGSVFATYYNQTWYCDTLYTHGNGNLSISPPGGNLYIAYKRGNTYFGGSTYFINRSGYFNGTAANADKVDGYHVWVGSSLPSSRTNNTIYILI